MRAREMGEGGVLKGPPLKASSRPWHRPFPPLEMLMRVSPSPQVPYQAWVWDNKIGKTDLFADLKSLLRLPDGRVPLKRKWATPTL